ncbi:MAG: radical SAM protein [Oligoflexia bacterium]|nr:radical SAM protein [Oligoflexia bacterium]
MQSLACSIKTNDKHKMDQKMIHTLAIAITNQCPLQCSFCCTPLRTGEIAEPMLIDIIDQALALNLFQNIGFTGGEPFVKFDLLCRVGRYLGDHNIPWGVTTSLATISKLHDVETHVERIKNAKIHHITISLDEEHLARRDPKIITSFIEKIISSTNINIEVSITRYPEQQKLSLPIDVTVFQKHSNFKVSYHYVVPAGRASSQHFKKTDNYDFCTNNSRCLLDSGLALSIYPSGDVFPCCSPYIVNKESALKLGNVFDSPLAGIIERLSNDIFFKIIIQKGFSGLIALLAKEVAWGKYLLPTPIDQCHFCSRIANDQEVLSLIKGLLHEKFR